MSAAGKVVAAGCLTVLLVGGGLITAGVMIYPRFRAWNQSSFVSDIFEQNETLREQVCHRRTSASGDVDLEDLTTTDVPGNDDRTRATATVVLHPPGLPVCRAPVRYEYQTLHIMTDTTYGTDRWGHHVPTDRTVILEVQVGNNAPVKLPLSS